MSSRLYYIITITNRVMGSKHFLDFYRAFGAPVVFSALAPPATICSAIWVWRPRKKPCCSPW